NPAAQGFTERDDVARRKAALQEPAMGRLCVQVSALLGRAALASAITAIVKEEDTNTSLQERIGQFEPVADVASIAVANQDGQMCAPGVGLCGKKPAVQADSIFGAERNVFDWTF